MQQVHFRGLRFFLKRDDLLHPVMGGNKARKLHYFLRRDFPHVRKLLSYGSMQSNAMCALSEVAKHRGWAFHYYTRINPKLLSQPEGNLKRALDNGMVLHALQELPLSEKNLYSMCHIENDTLIIPEGVRCPEAQEGIALLAREIATWAKAHAQESLPVVLPSGTGTSALYLQKYLRLYAPAMQVWTVPCVGDVAYLQQQFSVLEADATSHPKILTPPKRYRFGKLYGELFAVWCEIKEETGVEFDLLYDPIAFVTLLDMPFAEQFIYIHQGGLLGNVTMIARYKAKFGRI